MENIKNTTQMNFTNYDSPQKTLQGEQIKDRIIYLNSGVDGNSAEYIVNALKYLNKLNPVEPIQLLINSPGGSVVDGLTVVEAMHSISAPVYTAVTGMAASMGAVILAAGEPGYRMAYPLSSIMIHEGSTGTSGTISNANASMKFSNELILKTSAILAAATGKSIRQIQKDGVVDYWMTAEEAKEYGLIDKIIEPGNKAKKEQSDKVLKLLEAEKKRLAKEELKELNKKYK